MIKKSIKMKIALVVQTRLANCNVTANRHMKINAPPFKTFGALPDD